MSYPTITVDNHSTRENSTISLKATNHPDANRAVVGIAMGAYQVHSYFPETTALELVQKLRKLCEAAEQELQDSNRTWVSSTLEDATAEVSAG